MCIRRLYEWGLKKGDKKRQDTWRKIMRKRFESGYPYIVARQSKGATSPDVYKDKNRKINGWIVNLLRSLYLLPTISFVCDLVFHECFIL